MLIFGSYLMMSSGSKFRLGGGLFKGLSTDEKVIASDGMEMRDFRSLESILNEVVNVDLPKTLIQA